MFNAMNMDLHVKTISEQLAQAAETILDQNSSQEQRRQASQFCEDFKKNSIYLTNCGIYLCHANSTPRLKYFGLQLVQHGVKLKWNGLSPEEKANLKMITLQFVDMGSGTILEEPTYVKDAIARLAVEIMKREWPQNWPDLFLNLSNLSTKGASQLYIVLRILLRLAEEASMTDGNLPVARRKEMMSALISLIDELFQFFIKTLQFNVNEMKEMRMQYGQADHRKVLLPKILSECVLETLSGYVGWVNTKHLVQNNMVLLELLCLLLQDDDLKMLAAECLELIAGRKGKLSERKALLVLLNLDAMQIMFSAVTSAVQSGLDDENTTTFLKRVCNVLSLLGHQQLATIWGSECDDQGEPAHFSIYVEALMTFYQHKNMLITDAINRVWLAFLKNQDIAKNNTFRSFIPRLLEISKSKLSRDSHPLNKDQSRVFYSETDFGSFTDKKSLWAIVRSNTREIVQDITMIFPADTFLQAALWLLKRVENTQRSTTQVTVTETSEEYFEWEAMTCFFNSVLGKMFNSSKDLMSSRVTVEGTPTCISNLGRKCIETLINFETEDLAIMTLVITCLEALLPFLTYLHELLLPFIHKIFKAIAFISPHIDKSKGNDENALEFRRHSGALWIRLCLTHKSLMIEIIDELTKHIEGLLAQDSFNSQERGLLSEGLATISNGYMNYQKQSTYLENLIAPIKDIWMSSEMEQALSSTESLISFIGLDRNGEDETHCQSNRFRIQLCLRFILAVLKRVEPPKNTQDQLNGGFKAKPEDEPLNPLASLLLPLLSNFFHLNRVLNNIWHPDSLTKISAYYQPALEMHQTEKAIIIGLVEPEEKVKQSQQEKAKGSSLYGMQTFIFKLSESCAMILSDVSRLGHGLYSIPSIGQHLVTYVVSSWKYLPNYRLRVLIRNFLKFYCRMCPPAYYQSALVPIITSSFTLIIERLNEEWKKVRGRETFRPSAQDHVEENEDENDNEDKSDEVIENQVVHLMSKNFMETFYAICTLIRPTGTTTTTDETPEETSAEVKQPDDVLQELGKYLLTNPETFQIALCTPFVALQWPDSSAFVRATKLCIPVVKQVVQSPPSGVAMEPSMFVQLYTHLLKSLQIMGHNPEIQAQIMRSAIIVYDTLRPLFPEFKDILLQVPNANAQMINDYDKSLFADVVPISEKQKKKMFKTIVGELIGKEVGKMFQDDVTILNLPAPPPVPKKRSPPVLEGDIGLVKLFEPEATENNAGT